jgi:hypothetical protein
MANMSKNLLAERDAGLIRQTQAWVLGKGFDTEYARRLRREAILSNHAHYLDAIPVYRCFAQEEGIGPDTTVERIQQRLMLPDDIFKSYNQAWLDEGNFPRMNTWLAEIFHQKVDVDASGVDSIDGWIDRLGQNGIRLVYSSGTSGNFSFVPRDETNWDLFTSASSCYLAPLLLRRGVGRAWQRALAAPAMRMLSPADFAQIIHQVGVHEYDAFFLDFSSGHTGNQTLAQELSGLFHKKYFLYETSLSPTVLRLLVRGPQNERDRERLLQLQEVVQTRKEENYARLVERMRQSVHEGRKIFVFGTPALLKELCERIIARPETLHPRDGSLVLFGGGWKSFSGERISRDALVGLVTESLGLAPARILEGYSMTEINAFMLRCDHGRFHIPPTIEPVIFNEQLEPIYGTDLRGIFGFQDTLARAYPGFIISGDEVHYVEGDCACGLTGAAVVEIGRAQNREAKGCGGIMASLRA